MLWIILGIAAAILLFTYLLFRLVFYVPQKSKENRPEFDVPTGPIYDPYHDRMVDWVKEIRALPHEEFTIQSFDGLTLHGKYYESVPGAPIELMFHGYRGNAERDLCGGVQRVFSLGRNALVVNQRASVDSDGNVITFGLLERYDCLAWVDFAVKHFGPDVKIVLTGISMGASTVLMAAGMDLPENVVGILADCGFTSARDIIRKVIRQIKLPPNLLYPFIRLGAKLFGGFDLEETSALEAMKHCKVPVIFFHGEDDDYVPCEMSRINYEACAAPKKLVTIPGAGHGLSYVIAPEVYLDALAEVSKDWGIPTEVIRHSLRQKNPDGTCS